MTAAAGEDCSGNQQVCVTYQNCQIVHCYQSKNPLDLLLSDLMQRKISL